jgi:hypothetical protein
MLVMRLPDGTTCDYRLRSTKVGLRLERSYASYDLVTMVRNAGWTIQEVKTDIARRRLMRAFRRNDALCSHGHADALEAAM